MKDENEAERKRKERSKSVEGGHSAELRQLIQYCGGEEGVSILDGILDLPVF